MQSDTVLHKKTARLPPKIAVAKIIRISPPSRQLSGKRLNMHSAVFEVATAVRNGSFKEKPRGKNIPEAVRFAAAPPKESDISWKIPLGGCAGIISNEKGFSDIRRG